MIAAAADFVPVRIDVDRDVARLRGKYGARFTPTILFLDRGGARIGEHEGAWDAEAVAARLEDVAARHRGPWAPTLEVAIERAREAPRVVILVVWSDASEKPQARANAVLGDTITEVALALRPFDEEMRKLVEEDRAWILLDPLAEKPLEAPLARVAVAKDAKPDDLRAEVKKAREELARRHPK